MGLGVLSDLRSLVVGSANHPADTTRPLSLITRPRVWLSALSGPGWMLQGRPVQLNLEEYTYNLKLIVIWQCYFWILFLEGLNL